MKKLTYLRLFFILYFLIKIVVELVFGYEIFEDTLENMPVPGIIKSPAAFVIATLLSDGVLLLLGLLVFYYLIQKKNWARIILLIVGIINIIDAVSGLLFNTKIAAFLSYFISSADWGQMIFLDRMTDILGLIFWGYAVYILLFDDEVKQIFLSSADQNGITQ